MKKYRLLLLLSSLLSGQCNAQNVPNMKKINKNGMTVEWQTEGEYLRLVLSAPTKGWVAIGFNTADQLDGTNLLMGCVVDGKAILSDRSIIEPGDHRAIAELGGESAAQLISGTEHKGETRLDLLLPMRAPDRWHHTLEPGKTYTLLMAFSQEDDFQHHSSMRTSLSFSL